MNPEPQVAISFYELLSMSAAVLVSFGLMIWAFGKVLLTVFTKRMDDIDGKDGKMSLIQQHVDDTNEAHRETHNQIYREIGELRSRVDRVESKSVTEKEVRVIMAESLTPVTESMRLMNDNLGKLNESINKIGASVAILHDREEQRLRGSTRTWTTDETE